MSNSQHTVFLTRFKSHGWCFTHCLQKLLHGMFVHPAYMQDAHGVHHASHKNSRKWYTSTSFQEIMVFNNLVYNGQLVILRHALHYCRVFWYISLASSHNHLRSMCLLRQSFCRRPLFLQK